MAINVIKIELFKINSVVCDVIFCFELGERHKIPFNSGLVT